jgi:hypothetical protein
MMRRYLHFLLFVLLFLLYSCGTQTLAFQSLDRNPILRDFSSQSRHPDLMVFTNAQEVDRLLPQLAPSPVLMSLVDQLHQLDYDQFIAILAMQGQSGGSANITVQQIQRDGDRVIVYAQFVTPRGNGQTGDATDAYHLVAIPKDALAGRQIQFELIDNSLFGGEVVRVSKVIP